MRVVISACLLATACGRVGFESSGSDGPAGVDAEPPVDAPPAVAVSCEDSRPGALLCESFEAPDVVWDYTVFDQGTAARSLVRAANGAAALEANIDGSDNFKAARWGRNNVLPFLTRDELFIREYIYLSTPTVVTDQLSILVTGNQVDPFPSANVLLKPGSIGVAVEGSLSSTAMEFPRDRWVCVELQLAINNANGSVRLALDGEVVIERMGIDTAVEGGYTNIDAGVHYATPAQAAARMFVDEVVADTAAIGCD